MAQITEDYVSFETAKLLKGKGFNIPILSVWVDHSKMIDYPAAISISPNKEDWNNVTGSMKDIYFSAPTLQMAMKWLREIHNLCLFVIPATIDNILRPGYAIYPICDNKWEWCASKNDGSKAIFGCDINKDYCDSYENACEAAIKYCLENLI